MIILKNTTDTLKVTLGGAVATTEPSWYVAWTDTTTTSYGPNNSSGATSGATPVVITAAPAASTQRTIKYISVNNLDSAGVTVTISYFDNATEIVLCSLPLNSGDRLEYTDTVGFRVITAAGAYKVTTGGGGVGGSVTSVDFVSLKNRVSANSAQMTSADNALSNAISVIHNGLILKNVSADTSVAPTSAMKVYTADVNGISRPYIVDSAGRRIEISRDQTIVVRNGNAGNIINGQTVYIASATGGFAKVDLARADSLSTMAAIGLVRDAVISANAFGLVQLGGVLSTDTSLFADGDRLYVDASVAGAITNVKPSYPNYPQQIGTVINAAGAGGLLVHIDGIDALENISAISNAISVLSQQVSALSARVASNSAQMTSADNAISNAVSIVSVAAANALSVANAASNAVSVETVNRISADNALSNAVSIVSVAAANATQIAQAVSADLTSVKNTVSVLSQAVSVASVNAANALSVANAASNAVSVETVNRISADNVISNAVSIVSVAAANATSIANAASAAAAAVSADLTSVKNVVSVISQQVSVLSARVASNSAQMVSADNAISNAVSVVSVAAANATSIAQAVSADLTSVKNTVSVLSQAVSVLSVNTANALSIANAASNAVSVEIANRISAVNVVSNAVSIVSVAAASKNPIITVQEEGSNIASSPTTINFRGPGVSAKLSAGVVIVSVATGGGGGSVTSANFASLQSVVSALSVKEAALSNKVSANSAQMVSADNAISNAVSIVSVAAANATSIANAVSAAHASLVSDVARISNGLSAEIANRISADNALSNFISANFGQQISVLSVNINTLSNAVSVLSQNVSVLSAAVVVLSNNVSALSTAITVLSNQVSAAGGFQQIVVQGTQSISNSALTQISGLSISVAANAVYKFEAWVLYNVSAISATGFNIAFAASGFTQQTANGMWQGTSAMVVSTGGAAVAMLNQPFNGLSNASFSVASAGTAQINWSKMEAIVATSTTGGTAVIQARVTVGTTSMYIYKGSYIKAFKLI